MGRKSCFTGPCYCVKSSCRISIKKNRAFSWRSLSFFFAGTAGDSLDAHRGMPFSTKDRDNDKWSSSCALTFKGAWWYSDCYLSNLNGLYLPGKNDNEIICWYHWKKTWPCSSAKRAEMKIRPKGFLPS